MPRGVIVVVEGEGRRVVMDDDNYRAADVYALTLDLDENIGFDACVVRQPM